MKVNDHMILREIAGEHILLPVGERINTFHGIMSLNGSGLLLWKKLQQDCTEAELIAAVLDTYDVDPETAAKDVGEFLLQLKQAEVLIP